MAQTALLLAAMLGASAPSAAQPSLADTTSAEHLVQLGRQHLKAGTEGDVDQAIRLFHAALAANLDCVSALVGLSGAHRIQAPWDGGDRRGIDLAIALGEKATFLAPDDPDAHLALGEAYLAKRWYRQAAPHFQRVQDLRPDADAAYSLGWIATEMGDYVAASAWYDRAFALDSTHSGLLLEIGATARTLGDYVRAADVLRRGLEAHPDDAALNANLVLLFVQQGKTAEAVGHGARLIERAPENVDFLTTAATANWYAGHAEAAASLFERAMEEAEGEDPFIGWWGTYTSTALGDLYTRAGRHDNGKPMLDGSEAGYVARLREAGEGWGYLYDLARVHAARGERDEALR